MFVGVVGDPDEPVRNVQTSLGDQHVVIDGADVVNNPLLGGGKIGVGFGDFLVGDARLSRQFAAGDERFFDESALKAGRPIAPDFVALIADHRIGA